MDQMLQIPKNRRRAKVGRLCLLLGVTGLLYILLADRLGQMPAQLQEWTGN